MILPWIYLLLAGIFEVFWAVTLKLSDGFSNLFWSIATIVGILASFLLLTISLKHFPISLAYPVWTGIGAVGTIIAGLIIFQDKISSQTYFFILLLVIGLIGIKITTK